MDLGVAIVIFLAIAIIVMALFCLVTRYFNYKLKKALEEQNQIYSMIDQINGNNQQLEDGQYEEFMKIRQEQKQKPKKDHMIEMTEIKDPLIFDAINPYGVSPLKRRLAEGQGQDHQFSREATTNRTLKSFKPERLDSNRSRSSQFEEGELKERNRTKTKYEEFVTEHKYLSAIIAYTEDGIFITENDVTSVHKNSEFSEIIHKNKTKNSHIREGQNSFEDTLEAYGFEVSSYGGYKFITTIYIPYMKPLEHYLVKSLKSTEQKELINLTEFYQLKNKLEDEI